MPETKDLPSHVKAAAPSPLPRRIVNPALLICDIQTKFQNAIHEYSQVVATTQKMLKAAKLLDIPVFATTQQRSKLGETDPKLELDTPNGIHTEVHCDKTRFSMATPEMLSALGSLPQQPRPTCVIVGIESHICVLQTTLDLLANRFRVYVLADGVSSCNPEEVPIALARIRAAGAVVTTSESFLYELMGDAGIEEFSQVAKLVKSTKDATSSSLKALCKF